MKSYIYFFLAAAIFLFAACSTNEDEILPVIEDNNRAQTAILRLDGGIQHFDDGASSSSSAVTRAATSEWDDGAKLYIQYQTNNGKIKGVAVYSEHSDEWTVNYDGPITKNEVSTCEVYYFENQTSANNEAVSLNYTSSVFIDKDATYIYQDGVVHLKTHLMPQTGRIRFRGTPGYEFQLSGLKFFSKFNVSSNTMSYQNSVLSLSVGSDGFTPYIYAYFPDEANRKLSIENRGEDYLFYTTFDDMVLATGKSGYLDIPTTAVHNGWFTIETFHFCPDDNHPHIIDMGDAGKWACCNVGSSNPLEFGDRFAWGETTSKSYYDWTNYKWGLKDKQTKYVYSEGSQLDLDDDAAHSNWGSPWRMPTSGELTALIKDCTWKWTTYDNVSGCKIVASNGNTIFIPSTGLYWSSIAYPSYSWSYEANYAAALYFSYDDVSWMYSDGEIHYDLYVSTGYDRMNNLWGKKCEGHAIRPIAE